MPIPPVRITPIVIVLLLYFVIQTSATLGQDRLTDPQITERLQRIEQMLEQGKSAANLWWDGWLIGYGTATATQAAVGLTSDDRGTKQDMYLGAATTFLGVMGQVIAPMTPSSALDQLAAMPASTPEERKVKLQRAEQWLKDSAVREKSGRSWQTHAITGGVNLCSGLVVWLGFKRSVWEGAGNFLLNTAITELQIWTQPTRAIRDYENYCKQHKGGQSYGHAGERPRLDIAIYPGRLVLNFNF